MVLVLRVLFETRPRLRQLSYVAFAFWLGALNFLNLEYYRVDPAQGAAMKAAVQLYEEEMAKENEACIRLKRETFWDVTLASGPDLNCVELTSPG